MAPTRKLVKVRGHVLLETVRRGTGSEHQGLVLTTPDGTRLVLVELGENPFEVGGKRQLDGVDVEVEGYVIGGELRYRSVRPV